MQMFRYLSYKELVRVAAIAEMVELAQGRDRSSRRASPATRCTSCCRAACGSSKGDKIVAELGRGQHFGEMALVDRSVRSLTATADRGHAPRRDPPQGLLRHHQARAGERREDAVGFVQVLGAAAAQDHERPRPTRCTATSTGTRPKRRTCRRTDHAPPSVSLTLLLGLRRMRRVFGPRRTSSVADDAAEAARDVCPWRSRRLVSTRQRRAARCSRREWPRQRRGLRQRARPRSRDSRRALRFTA